MESLELKREDFLKEVKSFSNKDWERDGAGRWEPRWEWTEKVRRVGECSLVVG